MNGNHIKCSRCSGYGMYASWSFGVKEPTECSDCGGSGYLWVYNGGALAKYYGGPLIGRLTAAEMEKAQ